MARPRSVSVILIREHPEQMTGSGCCGKLGGDDSLAGDQSATFSEMRATQQHFGILHRSLRGLFANEVDGAAAESVQVVTVDPRNQIYLVAKLFRDVWRYRPGWRAAIYTLTQSFALPAVVVNGRVISRRGDPIDPDTVCHAVAAAGKDVAIVS